MSEARTTDDRGVPRVELPEKLGIFVPSDEDSTPVLKMLVAAGFSPDESAGRTPVLLDAGAENIEALSDWLEQNPEGHALMLFNAPVPTLAWQMADAVAPGDAIAQWRQHAEQVLGVVRHNRRRMTLIALEAAQADPGAFIDLLGDRFGLALKRPVDTGDAGDDPGAVFRMMAENAVWQSPDVRNLAAELEANALPMPPSHGQMLPAVEEVYSEFNTLKRTRARKEQLEEENELLLQQLHQVQEELETTFQKNRDLSGKLEALEKEKSVSAQSSEQLTELQTEFEQVKRQSGDRVKDLEEENELLLQQLHHVQEELESYFLENRDLRSKLEGAQNRQQQLEVELNNANNALAAVYASGSWRVAAPLRFLISPFMRGDKAISRKHQSES